MFAVYAGTYICSFDPFSKDVSAIPDPRGMNKKNHVTAITNVHGVFKAELPATR